MTHGKQWPLLAARGFHDMFAGTWIESDDPDEIARLLGSDPATAAPCGLEEAMREYEPYAFRELVWLGEHSSGWIHAVTIAGPRLRTDLLAAAGRRFVQVVWEPHGLGVHDLYYSDGTAAGRCSPVDIADPGWPFHEYTEGLVPRRPDLIDVFSAGPAEPVGSLGLWLENWLILAGRVSGRLIDEQYLDATRRLYSVPI
ncbi:hypothetical protein [Planomonospora venezuelensis]|uniref:Uncharacterized protein n=1 Tax=Planomonospora venezuelensis TaxID=1999 RepID=A0A841D167_PLAVE|nr:hypothetical protein [Planomonospora venezuelensis]MBB5961945.1 hypothetical protein [Planomonospora venezuelensis]GIM98969.1 hypothetical protein Pve01_06280 [Planomonospora venezuelensis]